MDEDDPEISLALSKLLGKDEAIVPQSWWSVTRTIINFRALGDISLHLTSYKDVTDSEMISPLRQSQQLEGRRKCLYIPILETWQKGTRTLVHSDWYSNIAILILAILTLASEALWQAPHRWPIFLPFTLFFLRVKSALDETILDKLSDWQSRASSIILVWYTCLYMPYQNLDGRYKHGTWPNEHNIIEKVEIETKKQHLVLESNTPDWLLQ